MVINLYPYGPRSVPLWLYPYGSCTLMTGILYGDVQCTEVITD